MRSRWWLCIGTALILLVSGAALADEHGHGHGHGQGKDKGHGHGKSDHGRAYYSAHDRDEIRGWYREQGNNLPPGLAKRDRLPPGLERQLRVRGALPPGLRKKMMPCPIELERRMPPPPPGYGHFAIGGHIVLVNRSTYMVMDIFTP